MNILAMYVAIGALAVIIGVFMLCCIVEDIKERRFNLSTLFISMIFIFVILLGVIVSIQGAHSGGIIWAEQSSFDYEK